MQQHKIFTIKSSSAKDSEGRDFTSKYSPSKRFSFNIFSNKRFHQQKLTTTNDFTKKKKKYSTALKNLNIINLKVLMHVLIVFLKILIRLFKLFMLKYINIII